MGNNEIWDIFFQWENIKSIKFLNVELKCKKDQNLLDDITNIMKSLGFRFSMFGVFDDINYDLTFKKTVTNIFDLNEIKLVSDKLNHYFKIDLLSKDEYLELKKPPLGLTPRWIRQKEFDQTRANEILEAIARYRANDIYIPVEWVDELKGLICNE